MKKYILLISLICLTILAYSQDTITTFSFINKNDAAVKEQHNYVVYTYPYPNGIVTNNIKKKGHIFVYSPIDNPLIEIRTKTNEGTKILIDSSAIYVNDYFYDYKFFKCQVFPIDSRTGAIIYSGIKKYPKIKKKDLYNALVNNMTNDFIKFKLLAKDDTNFSFQRYKGAFPAYFAGDLYNVTFIANIFFKDGKIKYKYSDFVAYFNKKRIKYDEIFGGNVSDDLHVKVLSKAYARGERNSDIKKFWKPINDYILQNINFIDNKLSEINNNNW